MGVFKMCYPFNKLRSFLFATTGIGFYAVVSLYLFFKNHILEHDILKMAVPDSSTLLIFLIFTIVSMAVERILALTIFKEQHRTEICPAHNFHD